MENANAPADPAGAFVSLVAAEGYANDDPAGEQSSTINVATGRTYERCAMSAQPSTAAGPRSSDRAPPARYLPTAIPKIANPPLLTFRMTDGVLVAVIGGL